MICVWLVFVFGQNLCLSVWLFVFFYVSLFVCLFVFLSVCQSVCLSPVGLFIYLYNIFPRLSSILVRVKPSTLNWQLWLPGVILLIIKDGSTTGKTDDKMWDEGVGYHFNVLWRDMPVSKYYKSSYHPRLKPSYYELKCVKT